MFEYNQSHAYEMVMYRHQQVVLQIQEDRRNRRLALEATAEQKALRKFRVMYRVRHWMHRVVPALARGLF
ncbi:MAG TPA: hypothetical protein VNT75_31835 [Symbiobacteriaceae bacterium]|nr:hypothetical protein [Symbiobacteriaceae bacterium]